MATLQDAAGTGGLFTDGDWILSENMAAEGSIGVIQLKHVGVGEFHKKKFQFIASATFDDLGCTEVLPGDVLISRMADPIGRACIVPRLPFRAVTAVDVSILRVDESVADSRFITHACNSKLVRSRIDKAARGTTRNRITRTELGETEIPLPPLPEQRRIAARLEQAYQLCRTRRYALELTDTLLPAAFLELFGDLHANGRKWRFEHLEENADIASGVAKGQKYGDSPTLEVPYLRVANVQDGFLDLSEIKTIRVPPVELEALRLQPGDVVMTEGGDFDKLGRGAIWTGGVQDCIHQNHIFRVRLNQSAILPPFFAAFLRSSFAKRYFLSCSKQTTNLASINMTQLRATPVPLPPLPLQQKFAALVERVERLRAVQREALRQAEHLFATLLHRAFSD